MLNHWTYEKILRQSNGVFQDMAHYLMQNRRRNEEVVVRTVLRTIIELQGLNEKYKQGLKQRKIDLARKKAEL